VSEFEKPERMDPDRKVSVDDVRQLAGASTPHFALHIRNRIRNLIGDLAEDDPARVEGERAIERLQRIARSGEDRGGSIGPEPEMPAIRGQRDSR